MNSRILNMDILSISQSELLENMNEGVLYTPNVDHLCKLQNNKAFYNAYRRAEWVVCDSRILLHASKLLKRPFRETIPGAYFFRNMPYQGWIAQNFTTMEEITAYLLLKELGNDALHKYIYENIAKSTFDSHRITNPFPQDFKDHYERMLIAHADEGDIRNRNVIIANRIGIYLGRNSRDLKIEKIGKVT